MKKEIEKLGLSKNFWYVVAAICGILIILIIIGFIIFANRKPFVVEENEDGGSLTLNYVSDIRGLSIVNAVPTSDVIGMQELTEGKYFDFSVETVLSNAKTLEYEVSIIKQVKDSNIEDKNIRVYLEKEKSGTYSKVFGPEPFTALKEKSKLGSKKGSMVLYKNKKIKAGVDNYRLRIWLSDSSVGVTGNYSVLVKVNGKAK